MFFLKIFLNYVKYFLKDHFRFGVTYVGWREGTRERETKHDIVCLPLFSIYLLSVYKVHTLCYLCSFI